MLRWTIKALLTERLALAGSVLGVAFALFLVCFFQAVFRGESTQIIAYPSHADADVWVMQKGVSSMHMSNSFIWDWKQDMVARIDGVAQVTPILYLNTVIQAGGRNWFSYVVGLEKDGRAGGPWQMAQGRAIPEPGEAVIPFVLSQVTGITIGDTIEITDKVFRIVGLSKGGFSMANSVTYVALKDLEDILSSEGTVSYLLVKAAPGVDAAALAGRIKDQVEKVNAMTREDFVNSDFSMAMQMGVEIIDLMTLIFTILAGVIVAFTAYSHVAKKRRELAIVKALGVGIGSIYASVLVQALLITTAGFLMTWLMAYLLLPVISAAIPILTLIVSFADLIGIAGLALAIASLASLVPAFSVVRIDPVSAFQT